MTALEMDLTTQKYLNKREEALRNIHILQQKLHKPVRIFSVKNKSNQKNAKMKGLSVEWVYQPKTRLSDRAHALPSLESSTMSGVYIRITVYDETHKQSYNESKKTHLIPLEALERLFWLADAIRAGRLFELYADIPPKDWGKSETLEGQAPKRDDRKRRFFERTQFAYFFGHENVLYDSQTMPKGVSNVTIGFCPRNEAGEIVRLPWKLTCWDALYDADEVYSKGACCFDGKQLRETAVFISQEQLLQILDGIYQTLCQLVDDDTTFVKK